MAPFSWRGPGMELFPVGRHIKFQKNYPDHSHECAEVFWIEEGHGYHRINGAMTSLQPGSLIMIRPQDRHGFGPANPGDMIQLTVISVPLEILNTLGQRYFSENSIFFWSNDILPFARDVDASRLRQLNEWAAELARSPHAAFYLDRFLLNLFEELSSDPEETSIDEAPGWLLRACAKAPEQLEAGVEGFFGLCGRSREHVSRVMRRYLNMTPTDYMNKLRMTYARQQLEMGNREILDIALDCGIENLSHFYSLFRGETGTTPRAYRLRHHRHI